MKNAGKSKRQRSWRHIHSIIQYRFHHKYSVEWGTGLESCSLAQRRQKRIRKKKRLKQKWETEWNGTKNNNAKPTEQWTKITEGEKRRQLQSYVRKRHQSGCKKPVQKACANHSDKIALTSANKKSQRQSKGRKKESKRQKVNKKKTRCLEANLLSMRRHFLTSAKHTRHLFRKWKTTSAVLANGSIAPIPTEKKFKK